MNPDLIWGSGLAPNFNQIWALVKGVKGDMHHWWLGSFPWETTSSVKTQRDFSRLLSSPEEERPFPSPIRNSAHNVTVYRASRLVERLGWDLQHTRRRKDIQLLAPRSKCVPEVHIMNTNKISFAWWRHTDKSTTGYTPTCTSQTLNHQLLLLKWQISCLKNIS